jgi:hypothetical protein
MSTPAHPAVPRRLARALGATVLSLLALTAQAEVRLPGIAQANLDPAAK